MSATNCLSCGDKTKAFQCSACGIVINDRCPDCHNEITHNIIKNQNFHLCGNRSKAIFDDEEYDVDSFKKACYAQT